MECDMMPSAAKITQTNANAARAGQSSIPMAAPTATGALAGTAQMNPAGEHFWSIGSPLIAGTNPHPYPELE